MRRWLAFSLLLLAGTFLAVRAAEEKKERQTFLTAEKAGPDFAIQGEYVGEIAGSGKLGAQVIADGGGQFTIWLLSGGLPGEGWDGRTQTKLSAKTESSKTTISGKALPALADLTGEIGDGQLTLSHSSHNVTLKRVVRESKTMGAKPPQGAIVLFDGTSADEWNGGKLVEDNLLQMGVVSKKAFKDFKLHIEFRLAFMPYARGQGRSNSGVYVQDRYEVQVLDSFGLKGLDNECGGIYHQIGPSVNMCYPPLSWQTYDIDFKAARFDQNGRKTANALITVVHNGVTVHNHLELSGPTPGGKKEEDTAGPIQLQNHGNPVYYRNIWAVETK